MIGYPLFWKTLEQSEENWYTLIKKHHVSDGTLHRLKHNMDVSMKTVNDLCRVLGCDIEDIAAYVPSEENQLLWWSAAYGRQPQENAYISKYRLPYWLQAFFAAQKYKVPPCF